MSREVNEENDPEFVDLHADCLGFDKEEGS